MINTRGGALLVTHPKYWISILQDDFEHEEIIGETKWSNAPDYIDVDKVIDLPNSTNAFIVNPKGANVTMQEAYYLPVSPHNNQVRKLRMKE